MKSNAGTSFFKAFIIMCVFLGHSNTWAASPLSLTYQGRILQPDGNPLSSSNVRFTIEIKSYNDCLLYKEIQSVNMSSSAGVFSLNIGSAPAPQTFNYVGSNLAAVFTNRGSFSGLSGCTSGVYAPNADDNRQILVSFEDMTLGSPTMETIPVQTVSYVPFAIESYQIAGYTSQNLLRVDGGTATPLTPANFTELLALLNGTSTQYVTSANNGVTSIAFATGDFTGGTVTSTGSVALKDVVTGATKGTATKVPQITFDNKGRITAVTEVDIIGVAPSGTAGGDLSGTYPNPTIGAGKIDTAKLADDSVTSAKIKDGEIVNVDISASAGIVDTKLATISSVGKVANSATTGTSTNTANTLVLRDTNGDFASRNITATQINSTETYATDFYLRNAGNKTAKFNLDPAVAANFNIVWPANPGSTGKILTNDGNGNLSWSTLDPSSLPAGTATQWKTSGSDIYYDTGSVGIGTASPAYSLDVNRDGGTYSDMVRIQNRNSAGGSTILYADNTGTTQAFTGYGNAGLGGPFANTFFFATNAKPLTFFTDETGVGDGIARMTIKPSTGNVGIGTTTPGSTLDVKGTLRLSGSTSGYVGFVPKAAAGSTTYTLPATDGSPGYALITDGSGSLSWGAPSAGSVTSITAGTGLNVGAGPGGSITSTGTLNVNVGTGANQIVQLNGSSQLPALDASLLTNLNPANLSSVVPISKGGTGQSTQTTAFNALSPLTTKGDLVTRDGTNNIRLPAGADFKYLRANSAQTSGLEYSDVTAVDLSSLSSTGIVKRTGAGAYATLGVQAPLIDTGTNLGLSTGNGLTVTGGNLVVNAGTGANQIPQLDGSGKLNSSVIPSGVTTQWLTSGSNIYYNSGNVGIGTTTPGETLQVDGKVRTYGLYFHAATSPMAGFAGIYQPAANVFGVYTNGAERMRIDASGNVGMGTTNPAAALDIQNTNDKAKVLVTQKSGSTGGATVYVAQYKDTSSVTAGSVIGAGFRGTSAAPTASQLGDDIFALVGMAASDSSWNSKEVGGIYLSAAENTSNTSSAGTIKFRTTASGSTTSTERMRIDQNGNIGIGTSNESARLHVANSNATAVRGVVSQQLNAGGWGGQFLAVSSDGSAGSETYPIGGYSLGVFSAGGVNAGSIYRSGWLSFDAVTNHSGTSQETSATLSLSPNGSVNPSAVMYWGSNGNVGVGTTNPQRRLHVRSDGAYQLRLENGSTGGGFWNISQSDNSFGAGGGKLLFIPDSETSTAAAVTITNSGNLGIGTTSPSSRLDVRTSANSSIKVNDGGLELQRSETSSATTGGYIDLKKNAGEDYRVRIAYDTGVGGSSEGGLAFYTNTDGNSSIPRIVVGGNGNVGMGTTAPALNLHVSSAGTLNGYTVIANENTAAGGNQWKWYASSSSAPLGANAMCFGLNSCVLQLYSSGNATLNGTLTQSSDVRLKRDVASIPNSLLSLSQLEGVTYYWKDIEKDQKQQIGLIAQNVEKVFPQAVNTDAQGFKSVAYQNLVAPIINAIKELYSKLTDIEARQNVRFQALEIKNQQLESSLAEKDKEIADLKARMDRLERTVNSK